MTVYFSEIVLYIVPRFSTKIATMKILFIVLATIIHYSVSLSIQESLFCSSNCICDTEKNIVNCSSVKFDKQINEDGFWKNSNNESYPFYKVSIQYSILNTLSIFPKSDIKIFDLSNNKIQELDDELFKNMQNLTEINLSNNLITSELLNPDIFKGVYTSDQYLPLKSLRILNFKNNLLHTLQSNFFEHISNIEILNLQGNPLRVLDIQTVIAISGLMNLRELDLSYTYLKKLPDNIFHTPKNLEKLDLSGNLFTKIPFDQLEDARNLKYLSLNENPIENITKDSGFPILEKLKILHLCYMNKLNRIEDESMSGLWNLEELYITNNNKLHNISGLALKRIVEETPTWPKITKLYLNDNHLSTISSSFLSNWDILTELNINDNSWLCDCNSQWILETLIPIANNLKKNGSTLRLHCAMPPEMENQNMEELSKTKENLRCSDLYEGRPERDAGILIGILIGLLLGIPLVLGILFCYKRNFFGVFNSGPASFSRKFYNPATMDEDFS